MSVVRRAVGALCVSVSCGVLVGCGSVDPNNVTADSVSPPDDTLVSPFSDEATRRLIGDVAAQIRGGDLDKAAESISENGLTSPEVQSVFLSGLDATQSRSTSF